jgi:hypothetical protein
MPERKEKEMSEEQAGYEVAHTAPQTPMQIIGAAVAQGVDADTLERLMALQERYDAGQAQKAYNQAVVEFQTRCPIVERGDSANGRAYARLDRIWRTVRPLMAECGLAVTWHECETTPDLVTIRGAITHRAGHSVAIMHTMPTPDRLNGQNAAQRAASAETYAKRYAICSALGIQTGDDDDGAATGGKVAAQIKPETLERLKALIEAKGSDVQKVCAFAKVDRLEDMSETVADKVIKMLAKK